jgi:hypothetical protein
MVFRNPVPILAAARAFDVEALRRELAAGVDPDILEFEDDPDSPVSRYGTPLYYAVLWDSRNPAERIRERLECISVLLEAGASVDKECKGATLLYQAVENSYPEYHAVIAALVQAGADVNFTRTCLHGRAYWRSVLARAAERNTAGAVRMLISAGAVDLDRALQLAIMNDKRRNCTPLLRAGAATPATLLGLPQTPPMHSYIRRIRAAGGFKAYEKAHRQRLAAIFLAKFPALPVEMLERVVEFSFDVGGPSIRYDLPPCQIRPARLPEFTILSGLGRVPAGWLQYALYD